MNLLLSISYIVSSAYRISTWISSQFQWNTLKTSIFSILVFISFVYSRLDRTLLLSSCQVYHRWPTDISSHYYPLSSLGWCIASHWNRQYFQNFHMRTHIKLIGLMIKPFIYLSPYETLSLLLFISEQCQLLFDYTLKRLPCKGSYWDYLTYQPQWFSSKFSIH